MTKEEALKKIEELKKYVEQCDKPKLTLEHLYGGATFIKRGDKNLPILTLIRIDMHNETMYGLINHKVMSAVIPAPGVVTKEKMLEFLNECGYEWYHGAIAAVKWPGQR